MGKTDKIMEEAGTILPVVLAGYWKRIVEGRYDAFFETKFAKKLENMDCRIKYGMELLLNIISALINKNIQDNSFLKSVFKDLLSDLPSEFSSRMLRRKLGANFTEVEAVLSENSDGLDWGKLLELEDQLPVLLAWALNLESERKAEVIEFIKKNSIENIKKFYALSDKTKNQLLDIIVSNSGGAAIGDKKFGIAVRELTLSMRKTREKLQIIRKGGTQ